MKAKDIKALLSTPKNIVIITHWSPDGDAIGSSLGLYNYLIRKKHKVTVVTPNDYPSFLSWLPGNKKVVDNKIDPKKAKSAIQKANIIFCLDFNSLKRIDELGPLVEKAKGFKFMIDHHQQPEEFADITLYDVTACSTCQLVYELISFLHDESLINKDIATCLYTGIMTDTGSFRFPSTTAKTHRIVAELIEAGAVNSYIHNAIYDDNTESRLKLLGFCLNEKLKVLSDYNTAFICLTADELKQYDYRKGDTEGVVNYALSIKGIRFAAFFVERDGIIKASFRSKGKFDVNQFARKNFDGGGHTNAAGGMSELSMDETILKFLELLPGYKKELTKKEK